jgi:mannose-6-phosphate isomerase-like protein (cupin superfamily)
MDRTVAPTRDLNAERGLVMWWRSSRTGIVLTIGMLGLASTGASEGLRPAPTQSRQLMFTVQRPAQLQSFAPSGGEAQLALLAQTPEMNIRVNKLTGRIKRHTHPQSTHFLYLIQGQIELTVGEETRRIQVGDFVTIPRGSVHAMQRVGTAEALFLDIASPPDVGGVIWHE